MTTYEGSKLNATHLERAAVVYVRQSTDFQVHNHVERQRLQYELTTHAKELGFRTVTVIDDDLGTSASGVHRPGFEKLLTAVCRGEVGLVLSLEASRLSRNGRDWHTLLDFCVIVGCLVGDKTTLYDPALPDDRFFLGMKGNFSEMELAVFRQRSMETLAAMAECGELFLNLPAGYEKVAGGGIEMTPDQRQRDAINLVFGKFAELRSVRQVYLWFRREGVAIPVRILQDGIVWKVPTAGSLHLMLGNPIYAGAYAFGRRERKTVIENGRKRVLRGIRKRYPRDWTVLHQDRHEGYITWEAFQRNQTLIAGNASRKHGAVRGGAALLAGVLRCGHCERRIQVRDNGKATGYSCPGETPAGGRACISFGAVRVDAAVGQAVIDALQPLGVEAALRAMDHQGEAGLAAVRLAQSALTEARYRADRAQAQFDAVDPDNPNVFHNLSRKWESCLVTVREREAQLQALQDRRERTAPTAEERAAYLALGADLERAWHSERVTPELRKHIVRAALVEITATVQEHQVHLLVHWRGGDHTALSVRRNRTGEHRWVTDAQTGDLIRDLARCLPDPLIAGLLNRLGKRTGKGNRWTKGRVRSFRSDHGVAVYREGERQARGEWILAEAADRLAVDRSVIRRLIKSGVLPARQACKGAPWIMAENALHAPQVVAAMVGRGPVTTDPKQKTLRFQ